MSNVRISCPTLGFVTLAGSRCASSLAHASLKLMATPYHFNLDDEVVRSYILHVMLQDFQDPSYNFRLEDLAARFCL